MKLQTEEGPDRQLNVIVLRPNALILGPLDSTVLLEPPVIGFHAPGPAREVLTIL